TYAAALGERPRRITLRDTRSRWGSCTASGELNFSWRLVMAPPMVLDYLVAHEMAHLREMNHSQRFWRLVAGVCPHMDAAEAWL
ncbi:M48 family metallopeptidase, partial [Klebsiella aerogenes]